MPNNTPRITTQNRTTRNRTTRAVATFLAVVVLMTTTFLSTARAATTSASIPVSFSGATSLGQYTASATSGSFTGSVTLSTDAVWSETGAFDIGWNPDNVRQGRHLDPQYSYDPVAGHLSITYLVTVVGSAQVTDADSIDVSFSVGVPMSGPCTPDSAGHYGTCTISSGDLVVFQPVPDSLVGSVLGLSPKVTLTLLASVQIGDLQADATRTAVSGGVDVAPSSVLHPAETTTTDPLTVGCKVGAGDSLTYSLNDVAAQRTLTFTTSVGLSIDVSLPVPLPVPYPDFPYVNVYSDSFPVDAGSGTLDLSHAGGSIDLGTVLANNIAPTVTTASTYSGDEGAAIAFTANATGPCADGGSYVWRFSDGTRQYGPSPHKLFTDSGSYTGSVTFTDVTGLSDTKAFSVSVANRAPVVSVLPGNATLAWGRDLTLSAQAVDPGAGDQSTLTYAWTFGDGTSVSAGGPSETHRWAAPGNYVVGLTVCDKDGACTSRNVPVTVTKRTTTTSYTGDNLGTYSATATLSGSVVDEFGAAVTGAQVTFQLGGSSVGEPATNAGGHASVTVVAPTAGDYPVGVSYAGSALYEPSGSASQTFHVNAMASTLTYTGAVTGKPNKAAPVSVRLVDALGRPIANKAVTVGIGTQQTVVTTNAQGVGTGSIVLNQKPGTYAISASWSGVSGMYLADTDAGVFKLNTK